MIAREGGHAPFSCVIKIASPGGGTVDKMVAPVKHEAAPKPVVSSFVDARKEPAAGGLDNSVEFMRVCAQRDVYKDLLMEIINKKV